MRRLARSAARPAARSSGLRFGLGCGLGCGLALALALVPAAARADRSYTSETQISHDCDKDGDKGKVVSINVSHATAVLTGTCARVSINGTENKVTIAAVKQLKVNGAKNTVGVTAADEIAVTGVGNNVTYKQGLSGKKPAVKAPGIDNKIGEVR